MVYKRIVLGFGIFNSLLFIYIIYSFLGHQGRIDLPEKTSLSDQDLLQENRIKLTSNHPAFLEQSDPRFKSFTFLLALALTLIPFILFFTFIVKKIYKYKRRQAELINVNKNKDLFFSIISHDLKTPAQNLISLSEINNGNHNPEEFARINQLIHTCSLKHYELLINLLDWSKTQFFGNQQTKSCCNIKQLVDENIYHQFDKIKEKNCRYPILLMTISPLRPMKIC